MNSDRCYHVPTSPGQTICTWRSRGRWLRLVIQVQAGYIVDLERRMQAGTPRLVEPAMNGRQP